MKGCIKLQIGDLIKKYRNLNGWSQKQLADMAYLTDRAISNYEAEIRTPDFETIKVLKRIMNIPSNELLGVDTMLEKKNNIKHLFSKSDFLRFCSMWEWRHSGADFDHNLFKETENGYEYTVFAETPYHFYLHHGQIIWEHSEWNTDFIEEFDSLLDELKNKVLFDSRQKFTVSFLDTSDDSHSLTIEGFESDTEEDLFPIANLESVFKGLDSLTECYDVNMKKAI